LQIFPNKQDTQPEVWACTTKAGHNNPWQVLCVDLIGTYTLKGKDSTNIEFMCLNIINPATSWFEKVELPNVTKFTIPTTGKGKKVTYNYYTKESETSFDKSSAQISNLLYKSWFSRYPHY
jgi:hypothetical protein